MKKQINWMNVQAQENIYISCENDRFIKNIPLDFSKTLLANA
ncbi:hypothetical protein GM3709_2691 [Geminocystis sp. NIES-3709]|nr:hypothetical protein GM3709_2691 [Geminocystis sp. NIES-3709]